MMLFITSSKICVYELNLILNSGLKLLNYP